MKIVTSINTTYDALLRHEAEEPPAISARLYRTVFLIYFAFVGKAYVCIALFRVRTIHIRSQHAECATQFDTTFTSTVFLRFVFDFLRLRIIVVALVSTYYCSCPSIH